ncbi:chemotaxis protein CheB [Azomonas macrocytogenes]|uniref:protein-glutamate methylesterase n=1 Tax=Azomonas macrocytogenes TaxID=69962 RepID=A0A839T888_AZOMA|nr:chemotaxis protein CheB [Azomonas macrocytogenes]MBB3103873.1 chemosensory pili system protein ChpB (putative protein-glutamate methylesterase) [Azomonas macrocytogenes]
MREDACAARIAVIADTSLQRHTLQRVLDVNGYQVVLNRDPQRLEEADLSACQADLWLIDLTQIEDSLLIDTLLEKSVVPVLFGEGDAPRQQSDEYSQWERRLVGKLKRLVGDSSRAVGPSLKALFEDAGQPARLEIPPALSSKRLQFGQPAREVWLLAAAMGGPGAVKGFLDALPGGLPVAFLYAQHIDARFETLLSQAVGRHSQWHIGPARHGEKLRCGEMVVVPVAQELAFGKDGSMQLGGVAWPEPYSPSIERMMLNLAQQFGAHCGVIVFSGMGSDGSNAAAYVSRRGGKLWTQQADGCACPSLPESLREIGYGLFSASPPGLARALLEHLAEQAVSELEISHE